MKLSLLTFLILSVSCSSTLYSGDGNRLLHISKHANREVVDLKEHRTIENMFYGNLPKQHKIAMGDGLFRNRSEYVSRVEISEYETGLQQLLKFLSLGLFNEKTIETRADADIGENEYEVFD